MTIPAEFTLFHYCRYTVVLLLTSSFLSLSSSVTPNIFRSILISLLLVVLFDLSSLGPNILTHTPTLAWLRLYRPLLSVSLVSFCQLYSAVLAVVFDSLYVSVISLTSFSGIPLLRKHQYITSLGISSNAFSRFTEPQNNDKLPSIVFSTICLTMKIASITLFPGIKPNSWRSISTNARIRLSNILSNIFSPCSSNLNPR